MAGLRAVTSVAAAESIYLDPIGCDSTVSYKIIHGKRYLWGSVQLADCNRKIEWYFNSNSKDVLTKADRAIAAPQAFRDRLAAEMAAKKKRRRKAPVKR